MRDLLETLSKTLFLLAGPAMQTAQAVISVCQASGELTKAMSKDPTAIPTNPNPVFVLCSELRQASRYCPFYFLSEPPASE